MSNLRAIRSMTEPIEFPIYFVFNYVLYAIIQLCSMMQLFILCSTKFCPVISLIDYNEDIKRSSWLNGYIVIPIYPTLTESLGPVSFLLIPNLKNNNN
jgi:hypothetical protein